MCDDSEWLILYISSVKFLHSVCSKPQSEKSAKKVEFSHEKFFAGHPWTVETSAGNRRDDKEKEQLLY